MGGSSPSLRSRIDWTRFRELRERELPRPVDALNLLSFADRPSYGVYGLLLAPTLLVRGARPVWVAGLERTLVGEPGAEEIVIVRYPHHRVLLDAVAGRYYSLVNRFRERGVRKMEFSITERVEESPELGRERLLLVARFDADGRGGEAAAQALGEAAAESGLGPVYGSREVATMAVFRQPVPSDPNPTRLKQTAVLAAAAGGAPSDALASGAADRLREAAADLELHLYRRLSAAESMPWARRAGPEGG